MKKNVLIFCYHPATQFVDICHQYGSLFNRSEYHVTVAYLKDEGHPEIVSKSGADDVIFLNEKKKAISGLKFTVFLKMLRLTFRKKFHIVICHRYKPFYLYLFIRKFIHIPFLLFVAHDEKTLASAKRRWVIRLLGDDKIFYAGVSKVMTNVLKKDLPQHALPHLFTLPNTLNIRNVDRFLLSKNEARAQLNIFLNSFVFGCIARFDKNKDQATLLRAFAKISSQCSNAILLLMGDGVLENDLKELSCQLKINHLVFFTGFIPDAFRYLKALDALILPSREKESFGKVLIESMYAKVPVIGAQTGAIPEVIGDCGIVFKAGDEFDLAEKMLAIYQDEIKREELGSRGCERVRKNYSYEEFKKIFQDFFAYE